MKQLMFKSFAKCILGANLTMSKYRAVRECRRMRLQLRMCSQDKTPRGDLPRLKLSPKSKNIEGQGGFIF